MYDAHFNETIQFTNVYQKLINCHIVDFITENLWNTCLPDAMRLELEKSEPNWNYYAHSDNHPILNRFLMLAKTLSLETCSVEINSKDFTNVLPKVNNENKCMCKSKIEFMNAKKFHEVKTLGNLVGTIAAETNSLVIDAGAGKAYLSTFLAETHNVPVLAIDSSESCSNGAICRLKKLQKKTSMASSSVQYVVQEINDKTDYISILKQNFCDWSINKNLILTGLHTCGSLTHSALRTFLATKDISILCIVPCCYHLTNETFNKEISFSKNARMLAQQSVERSTKNKFVASSLFYRAVLQIVLHSLGIYNASVGRGGPLDDFASYAQWALTKIGINLEKMPSREDLMETFEFYAHLRKRFYIFQMLRIHVGLVLEAAIMLDRIIFLQKSMQCSKLMILRLFDPMLSPRRYAIISVK